MTPQEKFIRWVADGMPGVPVQQRVREAVKRARCFVPPETDAFVVTSENRVALVVKPSVDDDTFQSLVQFTNGGPLYFEFWKDLRYATTKEVEASGLTGVNGLVVRA
jgi:hypothetical protein